MQYVFFESQIIQARFIEIVISLAEITKFTLYFQVLVTIVSLKLRMPVNARVARVTLRRVSPRSTICL